MKSGRLDWKPGSSRPPALCPGATVAVVAPAGAFPKDLLGRTASILEAAGYKVRTGRHGNSRDRYLAGPDALRAQDLHWALSDPEIHAVFCMRGGYGSSRLLSRIPFSSLPDPKIFCGYSDITFLHAALGTFAGWITFHGPNAIEFSDNERLLQDTLAYLTGASPFHWTIPKEGVLEPGRVRGILVGGNLTCFVHLLGTPFLPPLEDALLFVEDKNEPPYRIDRMLTHLKCAGVFDKIRGIIGGSFVGCGDPDEIRGLLREVATQWRIPTVIGMPFGHGPTNHVLPLGCPALLDTHAGIFEIPDPPFSRFDKA